jgi:hypothetical protein
MRNCTGDVHRVWHRRIHFAHSALERLHAYIKYLLCLLFASLIENIWFHARVILLQLALLCPQ